MEAKITEITKRPEATLDIVVKKEKTTVVMAAGLIRRLAAVVGDLQNMGAFYTDAALQSFCLVEVLRPRKVDGKNVASDEEADLDVYEISLEDADKLQKWVGDHLFYFFTNSIVTLEGSIKSPTETLKGLMSSLSGIAASAIPTPSAGDSTPSQASSQ